MNLIEVFHLFFRSPRITAPQMEVCFGACSLLKKRKLLLPLVKENAPKPHIMEMVVSKRYKVKQYN